ncbi:adenosylcobyric acid synthase (glutamine-hydrolysing) [Methylovirgula ligni]|uniref:Cobyric acid synthase n=1 Tax=Methylovirgula ligni TaxID=569860 RepID=A0A3D9Z307_9HYPH|nr:cobyric acid synthase [Methylovirgula ligni]REF89215.1 adenosylcobyric acid synthase (glutamine-hydrolysing) [Methylovirgula ligni]
MSARRIMFQGTGSDVGKSLIVAGLARAYRKRGLHVLPFKPQNMSNNAAVTADGGEIGRAQALQARAAGVAPSVHMNPVLLKPQSEIGAQVIVQGRVLGAAKAQEFQSWKPKLRAAVLESFAILAAQADLILVEGAGSPAEINLRANDIANMGFARAADCPVVLIGDIDRGGVIAQIAGTKLVLDPDDAALIRGFIVNKFRGDPALFAAGMEAIEKYSGWPALGLVPYFPDAVLLPAEDAVPRQRFASRGESRSLKIVAPVLPHIANFDDLDPLAAEPDVNLIMIPHGAPLPGDADLIVLPGSKATRSDMDALITEGWDIDIKAHVRRGKRVLGLCGGFQLLGRRIADPEGIEGEPGETAGLGLLDVETILGGDKTLLAVAGRSVPNNVPFKGYEMHVGRTWGPDCARPLHRLDDGREDGARSANGLVAGTYVHGLFADDAQRHAWLNSLGGVASGLAYEDQVERILDNFAAHLESCLDLDRLLSLAR